MTIIPNPLDYDSNRFFPTAGGGRLSPVNIFNLTSNYQIQYRDDQKSSSRKRDKSKSRRSRSSSTPRQTEKTEKTTPSKSKLVNHNYMDATSSISSLVHDIKNYETQKNIRYRPLTSIKNITILDINPEDSESPTIQEISSHSPTQGIPEILDYMENKKKKRSTSKSSKKPEIYHSDTEITNQKSTSTWKTTSNDTWSKIGKDLHQKCQIEREEKSSRKSNLKKSCSDTAKTKKSKKAPKTRVKDEDLQIHRYPSEKQSIVDEYKRIKGERKKIENLIRICEAKLDATIGIGGDLTAVNLVCC